MPLSINYSDLLSGRLRGPIAAAARGGLALLEAPYTWAVRRRNLRFDQGTAMAERVPAPVISVGNLTVGGTGKTPFATWLGQWLLERGVAVTIISRGYGSRNGRPNDEALELAARLPGVPQIQNPDRVAAAKEAIRKSPRQVLILDDAFQHRRLARDLDIVLLDATEPFGYEHLLPRGLLREPLEGLARAQVVALSRSDAVTQERRREIEERVRSLAPNAAWLELTHQPIGLVGASGHAIVLAALRGRRIAAFCGIGNPAGFRHTLASVGIHSECLLELPDHCAYGPRDMAKIMTWLKTQPDVEDVVCTRKDLVKIPHEQLAGKRLWALDIELQIVLGQDGLERRLRDVVAGIGVQEKQSGKSS